MAKESKEIRVLRRMIIKQNQTIGNLKVRISFLESNYELLWSMHNKDLAEMVNMVVTGKRN